MRFFSATLLMLAACQTVPNAQDMSSGCLTDTDCPGLTQWCDRNTGECYGPERFRVDLKISDLSVPDLMPRIDLRGCPPDQMLCNGVCISHSTDHCSRCGDKCSAFFVCCANADQTEWACSDLFDDKDHCGMCGNRCKDPKICVGTKCT